MTGTPTLGTLLRHLIDTLDGAVEDAYRRAGLNGYKPRYTPVIRALSALGPATIRSIASQARVSHSAASQTVSQMVKAGLLEVSAGEDARERIVALSPAAKAILPKLERQWRATEAAARTLDAELGQSLPDLLSRAIGILERRSFADRIAEAARSANAENQSQPRKSKSKGRKHA